LYMPQCTLTQHNHKKRNMNLNNSKWSYALSEKNKPMTYVKSLSNI
jgi:hypothetical protein